MASFNSSGWPQARDFLDNMRRLSIVAAQELHLFSKGRQQAEEWCVQRGWQPFITDAILSDFDKPRAWV
eukprot:1283502-Pyramimonas_sp.AAC.1